jgi:hypothetical protein
MATLKNLLAQEAALSSQQVALSTQQQALEQSLAGVRVHIAELQNMKAATYNLPSETLSAIFEAGLDEASHPTSRAQAFLECSHDPLPIPFEMLVSAVSRRWRNVALQMPRLWTNLWINFAQPTRGLHDLYLYRSKTSLLDITLIPFGRHKPDFSHADDVGACFKQHMELLIPHVGRWRKLVIQRAFTGGFTEQYSILTHLYAPALETLEADIHTQPQLDMEVFSGGAPRLSSVVLYGPYFRPPPGTIKYLSLSYIGPPISHGQFSQLIRPMSSLTHLMMELTVFEDTNIPSIALPSVISLDIGQSDLSGHSVDVLRFLDLPAVEKLTFRGYSYDMIRVVAQNGRLYPSVTSLTMTRISQDINHAHRDNTPVTINFMSLLPNVRDVTFQGGDSTPILHALHDHQSTNTPLWPHLFAITVTPAIKARVSLKMQMWDYVVKIVESRLQLGTPISHITLSSQIIGRISSKQQQWLRGQVTLIEC